MEVINVPGLPKGKYFLLEAYCDEPNCDCRRVIFNILEEKGKQPIAIIGYGWEKREYYIKWFGNNDKSEIDELKGPSLNTLSIQSEYAPIILDNMKYILKDKKYIERIKNHYNMFKAEIDKKKI